MIATFYMLSETVQRDISEPEFFRYVRNRPG